MSKNKHKERLAALIGWLAELRTKKPSFLESVINEETR